MRNRSSGPGIPVASRKLVLRIGSRSSAYRTSCLTPSAEGTELLHRYPKKLAEQWALSGDSTILSFTGVQKC